MALLVGSMVLTGCSKQARKTEKAPVKVETFTVGTNAEGKTKDYVGTIEEKTASNWAATSRPYASMRATR